MRFVERVERCRLDHLFVHPCAGFRFVLPKCLRFLDELSFDLFDDFLDLLTDTASEIVRFCK